MKYIQRLQHIKKWIAGLLSSPMLLLILLAGLTGGGLARPAQAARQARPLLSLWNQLPQNTLPFMHRPYYGSAQLPARINSYFDHDKPWYAADNIFVRYDGRRWTGSDVSVLNCQPGSTCYDGHNGYDLRMRFEPVLSSASGKVIRAGWYNPQNHNDSFGLWVTIDHGNGFATVYGHLSALTVSVGDHVGSQWQIGTSGTTGSSTGPHLHFGTYYYPSWQATDPSGWKGSYADPNIVPDHTLWISGTNDSPVPLLGGHGKQLAPGALLLDDSSPDWSHTGQWQKATASSDIDGSLHWTSTTSGAATASATWRAHVPADGYYEVGVFVDDNHASSGWAPYTIYSADPARAGVTLKHVVEVDQEHIGNFQNSFGPVNTGAQWIGLGTYYFRSAQPGRVTLSNATGESDQQLAADGIEIAPLAPTLYNFSLVDDNTPAQMAAGSSAKIDLTLKNTSTFIWPARGQNAVQLLYRWLDSQGHAVSTGQPISLAQDLAVNATEPVEVNVQAPAQAGTYTLQWDLIQGSQTFSKAGAQPKNDSVTVAGGLPNPSPTPTRSPSPTPSWRRKR
jgi:murein DD-endopeptidase MepM/ murein hydrolase activator NlpD